MTKFIRMAMTIVTVALLPVAMVIVGFRYAMETVDEYVRGMR